jgi:hypothetical protein
MSKMQAKMNSSLGTIPLVGIDPSMADVFGRLKITRHQAMFDTDLEYGLQSTRWEGLNSANAIISHLPAQGGVLLQLNANAVAGDYAIRQTKRYFRYQSGKQQYTSAAALFGVPDANVINRVGMFDDCNGLFFEQNPADVSTNVNVQGNQINPNGISVVKRATIAGVPTDTKIAKQNWNVDKMDGTGPSALNLDFTKLQMFSIQFAWYGAGVATFGFYVDGRFFPVHIFKHANVVTQAYMRTGNLPARYEIRATGSLSGISTLYHYGTSVMTEGGFDVDRGYIYAGSNGPTSISAGLTSRRPICSVRVKQVATSATTGTATGGSSSTLTVSGTPWTVNAYAGLFLIMTSGSNANKPILILSNTNNTLTFDTTQLLFPTFTPLNAETFTIGLLNRGGLLPTDIDVYSAGGAAFIEVVLNPASITGASWSDIGGTSLSQKDVSATALSGGEVVASYYATKDTITRVDLTGLYPLGLNTKGLVSDILSVMVTPLVGGGAITAANATIRFSEAQS